jgi:hypothetical protein
MNRPLPLYPGAEPCVNSGFCCRQAACPFGKWDADKHACTYLTEDNLCGKYEEILSLPREQWEFSPAFGAGCGSALFNEARQRIIENDVAMRTRVLNARALYRGRFEDERPIES